MALSRVLALSVGREAHDALGGMSAGTAPPGLVTRMLNGFGNLQQSHAFAVNLTVVALLAALGAGIVIGTARHGSRPWLLRAMVVAAVVACLADRVFVENLGVLGGLGTDPDSMPPLALLVAGGYLTLVKVPELESASLDDGTAAGPGETKRAVPGGCRRARPRGGIPRGRGHARRWGGPGRCLGSHCC